MQGNSLIKTFAILFGIVSIYQLSFTFISSTLENKARNAAIDKFSEDEILKVYSKKSNEYFDSYMAWKEKLTLFLENND